MKNQEITKSEITQLNAALNYILNKFMPLICVSFILFYSLGFSSYIPYLVIGFIMFSNKYSFLCGYADAVMTSDLKLDNQAKDNYLSKDEY
tara:strand:+ start:48 stop:320 length:273 start_codon:yes stop_codon:yes gene_type:complete